MLRVRRDTAIIQSEARLLVVDDTPENALLLEAMLSPHGYSVALAYSGTDSLEKIRTEHPDVVLLDILMPDVTGYEVCRRIRANPLTRLLPVIMLTSSGDQDKVDSIEAGADDFIARPLDPRELLSRVRPLLRIKAYQDAIQAEAAMFMSRLRGRSSEARVSRSIVHGSDTVTNDTNACVCIQELRRNSPSPYVRALAPSRNFSRSDSKLPSVNRNVDPPTFPCCMSA